MTIVALWIVAAAASLIYNRTSSESLSGLPLVMLIMFGLPALGVGFGLWLAVTSGGPLGPGRRMLGHALPWLTVLGPVAFMLVTAPR